MLEAGPVDITISVDTSSVGLRDAADRNVDVLMLTQNTSDWENRMLDENLPGDGLLSQAGEIFFRIKNTGADGLLIFVPVRSPFSKCRLSSASNHLVLWPGRSNQKPVVGSPASDSPSHRHRREDQPHRP